MQASTKSNGATIRVTASYPRKHQPRLPDVATKLGECSNPNNQSEVLNLTQTDSQRLTVREKLLSNLMAGSFSTDDLDLLITLDSDEQ